ncbi:MAG: phytanoyl-CoA dioxygenase family protein [Devosia sp.]
MTDYDLQDFLFDLRGFLILEKAVEQPLLKDLNTAFDNFPALGSWGWWGNVQRWDAGNENAGGVELQNIVEGGKPFEALIDHPAWIDRLRRYCGEAGTYVEGLFIDECFASVRRSGGYSPMHSGGQDGVVRNQFGFANGQFRCGQVNILLALTDIGPGDGGTLVLPGSHKSNFAHPMFRREMSARVADQNEKIEGSMEVHLKAGDALMFVDAMAHGATKRINAGERRVVIYRYGPSWGTNRYGYQWSKDLLDRLTPVQRKILQPITPRVAGDARKSESYA